MECQRIELACDYLTHEFRKIFPFISRKDARDAIMRQAPTQTNNGDVAIRDFWNLFSAMSYGWRLKNLHRNVTAENVTWAKKEIPVNLLIPGTRQGWMKKIEPYDFNRSVVYLCEGNNLREAIEDTEKYRKGRAEGDESDPLIAIKCENFYRIEDGNSRLNQIIERGVEKQEGIPHALAWTGIPEGYPRNFWVPTSALFFLKHDMKRLEIEFELNTLSQLAFIEYCKRVKNF